MADVTNDNESTAVVDAPRPDAHGMAAMLLVESLIHGLIGKSVISTGEALDIVGVASDVVAEIAADRGDASETTQPSQTILGAISKSLRGGQ